ncbi:hypothetical protein [Kitasatospora sp. NPDC093806]|uniref:hypothetical protein n=1 Tax=Kitasatospora sp. NPDC093806 TaxID=3155075 RepID=UPI0034163F6B
MNRPLAILATSAVLTAAGVTQAAARTTDGPAGGPAVASTTGITAGASSVPAPGTCVTGYRGVVVDEICAVVNGDQVVFFGQAAPSSVAWTARPVSFRFTATVVGGAELGTVTPTVVIGGTTTSVGRLSGVVPCGATAAATLEVTQWGWPPSTVTLAVPAGC